jgi:hypothetical protein
MWQVASRIMALGTFIVCRSLAGRVAISGEVAFDWLLKDLRAEAQAAGPM